MRLVSTAGQPRRTMPGPRQRRGGAAAGAPSSSPPAAAGAPAAGGDGGYVFVTVGTTSFDAMVEAVTSPAFAAAVAARGHPRVVVQVGRGAFLPPAGGGTGGAGGAGDAGPWEFPVPAAGAPGGVVHYSAYRFKADIGGDLRGAAAVVSHAGAGSIFEALRARRPLLVVVNPALADNHQVEIAEALAAPEGAGGVQGGGRAHLGPHLAWCHPGGVVPAFAALDPRGLKPLPPKDASAFTAAVDELMGAGRG
jgi:beta-1,4-N-acetylglucosaminyltransferase